MARSLAPAGCSEQYYATGVPADQSEFYKIYFPYVKRFVIKYGSIKPDDAEDVSQSIWVRLLARDVLGQFDLNFDIVHDGKRYKAKFETYLARMLELYVRHYRAKQFKMAKREIMAVDPLSSPEEFLEALAHSSPSAFDFDVMEESELLLLLENRLTEAPDCGPVSMSRLFQVVIFHARYAGKVNTKWAAETLGVSVVAVRAALKDLRLHVRAALESEVLV